MGSKPRVCSICGAKGALALCRGTGQLTGVNLKRAMDMAGIDHDKVKGQFNQVVIPCPGKKDWENS